MFKEYTHVERFGNEGVEGIELGKVYVFPKLDGTNASIWLDEGTNYQTTLDRERVPLLGAGSRTRELGLGKEDNAGFLESLFYGGGNKYEALFYHENPKFQCWRLFGEWLVPHSFKGYRPEAWRQFYVFDVYNDETNQYLPYEVYQPILEQFGIIYIPPLAIIKNGSYENFLKCVHENFFLCPDGGEPGEGIVIKNYDYQNKFGRQCFAKIVRQEFKELHARTMGAPEINTGSMNEERILNKCLTTLLIEKTINKMVVEGTPTPTGKIRPGLEGFTDMEIIPRGWTSKMIPELFGRVFYDIVTEELFDSLKEINFGTVNFKTLKAMMIMRIKQLKPEVF